MRISTLEFYNRNVNSIMDQQAKVNTTQLHMASGLRMLSPSDDPAGSGLAIQFRDALSMTEQHQKNVKTATSRLDLEEITLSSVTDNLQRARELALQANNGTQSLESRLSITKEIRLLLDNIVGLANTRDATGEYIFSGSQGNTRPITQTAQRFEYHGDDGQRQLQIAPNQKVAVDDPGSNVFMRIATGNGVFNAQADEKNTGKGVIDLGSLSDPSHYDGRSYEVLMPAEIPVNIDAFKINDNDNTVSHKDPLSYTLKVNGVTILEYQNENDKIADLPALANKINEYTLQTGVEAYIDAKDNTLKFKNNDNNLERTISVEESMSGQIAGETGLTDGDLDTITGYFGHTLKGDSHPSQTYTFVPDVNTSADATLFQFHDDEGTSATSGLLGYQLKINDQVVYTVDEYTSESSDPPLITSVSQLADIINKAQVGAKAYAFENKLYLLNDPTSNQAIKVTESMTGSSEEGGYDPQWDNIETYLGNTLTGSQPSLDVTFDDSAATRYIVVDDQDQVKMAGDFASGITIPIGGIQTAITGTPNRFDRFTISQSQYKDTFSVVKSLIDDIEQKTDASLNNAINQALTGIDMAMKRLQETIALVGARQGLIEHQDSVNQDVILRANTVISQISDLDYAEAVGDFDSQMAGLQAAQETYSRVGQLSLFNYLK